jgi:hypothetical protein
MTIILFEVGINIAPYAPPRLANKPAASFLFRRAFDAATDHHSAETHLAGFARAAFSESCRP